MKTYDEAVQERNDALLDDVLEQACDIIFSEADTVGPDARHHLKGLLRYYAKKPHPFRACVKDNMKRFGPGRTEAVCATLKDIIRGTTRWRGHPELDHGAPGVATALSEGVPEITPDLCDFLMNLSDEKLALVEIKLSEAY